MTRTRSGRRAILVGGLVLALVASGSCSDDDDPGGVGGDLIAADVERVAADPGAAAQAGSAVSALGVDLYTVLRAGEGNLAVSPFSVAAALAMTRAGAAGVTADEMDRVLHAELLDDLHLAFGSLDAELATRPASFPGDGGPDRELELSFGNAVWPQRGLDLRDPFLETLATAYGAGVRVVDYVEETEEARLAINGWVGEQTRARIPELIAPDVLSSQTRLVLTNAVYLQAPWQHPFDVERTDDAPFTRLDGTDVDVPTMHVSADLAYRAGAGWQSVVLPYLGGDLVMVVVVPDAGTFETFEAALDAATLTAIDAGLATRTVELALPRWEQRTQVSLADPLARLGMPSAFAADADFSAMSPEPLAITDVLHEVFASVDEAGTEAAAATAVVIGETAAEPTEPVTLSIDRPFVYWIVDRPTGATLFLGRVLDPSAG
jgi:serine protease inhibitor